MKGYEHSKIPRLFELMAEKGIKAVELARQVKVSTGNVTDWKMGRAMPTSGVLVSVASFLGTTPEYLLGETDIKEMPDTITDVEREQIYREIVTVYSAMNKEQRQAVLDYANYLKGKGE